jgi:hypothetical protein
MPAGRERAGLRNAIGASSRRLVVTGGWETVVVGGCVTDATGLADPEQAVSASTAMPARYVRIEIVTRL